MYNNDDAAEKMAQAFLKSASIFLGSFLLNAGFWIWLCVRSEPDALLMLATNLPIALVYVLARQAIERYQSKNSLYFTNNLQRYALLESLSQNIWVFQLGLSCSIAVLLHTPTSREMLAWTIVPFGGLILIGSTWANYKLNLWRAIERRRELNIRND